MPRHDHPGDRTADVGLLADAQHLARLARAKLAPDHPVITTCNAALNPPGREPTVRDLLSLRFAFFTLPPEVLLDVMNGWQPCPDRPTPANRDTEMHRRLLLTTPLDLGNTFGVADFQVWDDSDFSSPLMVLIHEGAAQNDVLTRLDLIRQTIVKRWARMIAGCPSGGMPRSGQN